MTLLQYIHTCTAKALPLCVCVCVCALFLCDTYASMLHDVCVTFTHNTGHLIARHREVFSRNPLFIGMRLPEARELEPLERRYPRLSPAAMDIIKVSSA